MKKGEMRRKEILDAAEKLFYEKGYEATSVQDILDALQLSKGGFYHHFDTKMSVLEAICDRRAEAQFEAAAQEIRTSREGTLERLNKLLSKLSLFEREEIPFIAMVLRVAYMEGDLTLRERMKAVTVRLFLPLMDETIARGISERLFFTRHPGTISRMLLLLAHDAADEAAMVLTANANSPESVIEVIDLMNTYRDSVELLLNAPYGSIRIFEVDHLLEVFRGVMAELKHRNDIVMEGNT